MAPIPHITIFLLFISTLLLFSNGSKEYQICSVPTSCGQLNDIRYPFWVENHLPKYCGLPQFRLTCYAGDNYPRVWIGGTYRVLSINTSNHTILVDRVRNDSCDALDTQHSGLRESSPYNLGASAVTITLFIGCPSETNATGFHRVSILCLGLNVNVTVYYAEGAEGGSKCKRNVTMPVSRKAFHEFVNSGYDGATLDSGLQDPFEVDYLVNLKECWACQKSGGVCGSSILAEPESDKLVCYHRGKPHLLVLLLGLGITGSVVLMVALVAFCYCNTLKFFCSNFISRILSIDNTTSDIEIGSLCFDVPLFSYKDLEEATNNFNDSRELGSGGFGRVYYGKLKDGREVAVKQLYEKSYRRVEQFMNEVQILTRLRHQNLVCLYGCTSPHCRELLLVYEYICNGTVSDHLDGKKSNSSFLSWPTRMRIAIETASALSYLHASDIIHRDVKTNNFCLMAILVSRWQILGYPDSSPVM